MMKNNMKRSCFVFALVLILTMMLPMAALAATEEIDEHGHVGCACAEATAIKCTHPIKSTIYGYKVLQITASGHLVEDTICYTCTTCGYTYTELTGVKHLEPHQYRLNNGGIAAACIVCGYPNPA